MNVSSEGRIRVGVSLEGRRIARWKHDVLRELLATEAVELALVVLTPRRRSPDRGAAAALLGLYRAADRRVFASDPDPLVRVDASPLLEGVPTVDRGKRGAGGTAPVPLDVRSRSATRATRS